MWIKFSFCIIVWLSDKCLSCRWVYASRIESLGESPAGFQNSHDETQNLIGSSSTQQFCHLYNDKFNENTCFTAPLIRYIQELVNLYYDRVGYKMSANLQSLIYQNRRWNCNPAYFVYYNLWRDAVNNAKMRHDETQPETYTARWILQDMYVQLHAIVCL